MVETQRLFILGFILFVCYINSSEGGRCYKIVKHYRYYYLCTCWWWWRCTHRRRIASPYYSTESYCCTGYTGSDCNTPICNPPCKNGGTCYRPNQCRCRAEFVGNDCQQVVCSHLKPCFPGTCTYPDSCDCQSGFRGSARCLTMQEEESADITKASASLVYIHRSTKEETYRYDTDSTSPNVSIVDELWINERDFNYINIYMEAIYVPPTLQVAPRYVQRYGFGITGGTAEVLLEKISRQNGPSFISKNDTYICPVRQRNDPEMFVYKCNVTDENFDRILEHGDNMTVTLRANNGGYRDLLRLSDFLYDRTEYYYGRTSHKTMVYHFDFEKPVHCSENGLCSTKPFMLDSDITKNEISSNWGGWIDSLAGVFRYTWEVFKLQPNKYSKFLTEPEPMRPLKHLRLNSNVRQYRYTPDSPGMYSIILEVKDKANNSRYCRQLVLYDPVSSITLNNSTTTKLFVASAAAETMHKWQPNLQNEQHIGKPIAISWKGHFVNSFHENQYLLNKVLPYPKQEFNITTGSVRTFKSVDFDDNDGKRTVNPVSNIHGIIKFEYVYKKDHKGGELIKEVPDSGWIIVPNPLTEEVTMDATRQDGDTVRIWIRATDVLGNAKIDSTEVTFDSTHPVIQSANMQRNVLNSSFPFSSRVYVTAKDEEAGVYKITWRIKDAVNGKVFKEGEAPGNRTAVCSDFRECYKVPMGEGFNYHNEFIINNCWMVVPKDKLDTQVLTMELHVFNMALISNGTDLKIDDLRTFSGMEDYSGPMNVRVTQKLSNGVRLEWDQSPSCYERVEIQILNGKTKLAIVHKDATSYDLVGLNPEQNYTIVLVTAYGDQLSNPVSVSFITAPKEGISAGGIAGIVIVILILVGIIIVGIVMWRTGRLNTAKQTIKRRLTRHPNTGRRHTNAKGHSIRFNNLSYAAQADDIYLYGGMKFDSKQNWQIPHGQITLIEKLCCGRFADIYKARGELKQNDKTEVVAKVLKETHTDEDEFLMQAKINFFATKVGSHPNVIEMIGAVVDNEALGPYMVLELCAEGTLKEWLDKKKNSATDDTVEKLFRIVFDISKGMEHLASLTIVHRRLAARNIFLNTQLEAKIAGFGPSCDQDGEEELNNKKPERIPVKWMAPECMTTTKDANEASDVWSFAIVMWEVFSLGDTPYEGIKSRDVPKRVKDGYRMGRPELCEDVHYNIMQKCWDVKAKKRPTFKDITEELRNTFVAGTSDEFYYYSEK